MRALGHMHEMDIMTWWGRGAAEVNFRKDRKMKKDDLQERAHNLINTSVQDMQSGLWFYQGADADHIEIVKRCLAICKRRGERTKVRLLESKLRKMKNETHGQLRLRVVEPVKEGA
jgi:hypothetical protein